MKHKSKLSEREWEVVNLLLQGKSNKMIAASLGISKRTVEFHLRNIFGKFQVGSRVELILELVKTTGGIDIEKLRDSTVAKKRKGLENGNRPELGTDWKNRIREWFTVTIDKINEEDDEMKVLRSKLAIVGAIAAMLTGFLLILTLGEIGYLSADDFTEFFIPVTVVFILIGGVVGWFGEQSEKTLVGVLFSVVFGTGVSLPVAVSLTYVVVFSVRWFIARKEIVDVALLAGKTFSTLAMSILILFWLVGSVIIGYGLLFSFTNKPQESKPQQAS